MGSGGRRYTIQKTIIIIVALIAFAVCINAWQRPDTVIETHTDTLTVYESIPAETLYSTIVKYKYKTVEDSNKLDSLQSILDSVLVELSNGTVREYVDTVKFETGDSLHTTIRGVLFAPIVYKFYPAPDQVKYVTNTTTIDSRDNIWFSVMPIFGIKVAHESFVTECDLLISRKNIAIGIGLGYDWNNNNLYKGIKFSKIYDISHTSFGF